MRTNERWRRGFVTWDAVIGLILVGAMLAAVLQSVASYHKGARALADDRTGMRAAEEHLTLLQAGQTGKTPTTQAGAVRIEVTPLKHEAPQGQAWVEVKTVYQGRTSQLVGLVPAAGAREDGR